MATIKEIIQGFCYRINIPAPSTIVGVTSQTELQYLSLFKKIGDMLRDMPHQWPQLKRPYTFTTATGSRNIRLPGDFHRILESSQWDTTHKWPMRGPISDYNFNVREFAVVSLQTRKAFRLIGPTAHLFSTSPYTQRSAGTFEIDPAGQNNTDQMFFGYMSANWVWPRDWVASTSYSLGDIRSGDGSVWIVTTAGTSSTVRPSGTSGTFADGGTLVWTFYTEPYPVTPSNTNLNDNDLCLFDDDLMIEGMIWAYYQAKKQDYQQERADWEQNVKNAVARFNGPVRINMSDEFGDYFDWPNVPPGSWNV